MKRFTQRLSICIGLFFTMSGVGVFAQQELPPELAGVETSSYGTNVSQGKDLYSSNKEDIKNRYKPKFDIKTPYPYIYQFWEDVKQSLPDYFKYIWYVSIFFISITQLWLARSFLHRNTMMALPLLGIGALLYLQEFQDIEIVAKPLLVGAMLFLPLWQLFQFSHKQFYQFLAVNITFFVVAIGTSLFGAETVHFFLFWTWAGYLAWIALQVFVGIAFRAYNGSWTIIFALIPFTGPVLFNLLCISSIEKEEDVSPKFVNIILDLINKGKNRVEIRSYALKANIRMNYFDKNYDHAIRLYKRKKKHMSKFFYQFNKRFIWVFLTIFFLINAVQVSFLAKNVHEYYQEYSVIREKELFMEAIKDDNNFLIEQYISEGADLNPECAEKWANCHPLYVALESDSLFAFKVLLAEGADIYATDPAGVDIITHARLLNRVSPEWKVALKQ